MTVDSAKKKRYYRKNVDFFKFVEKIKLWPSRSGNLHGIKSMTIRGNTAEIITHCNEKFQILILKIAVRHVVFEINCFFIPVVPAKFRTGNWKNTHQLTLIKTMAPACEVN